jgi:hypothetical protein
MHAPVLPTSQLSKFLHFMKVDTRRYRLLMGVVCIYIKKERETNRMIDAKCPPLVLDLYKVNEG